MYDVYSVIKAEDSSDRSDPYVDIYYSSNSFESCKEELEKLYNDYLEDIKTSYSEDCKEHDWYKEMIKSIEQSWIDSRHEAFIDDSGYKHYIKFCIIKVM